MQETQSAENTPFIKLILGSLLIILGICFSIFLITQIFGIISGDEVPGLVQKVIPLDEPERQIQVGEQIMILPTSAYKIVGYLVVALYFFAGAGLTAGLLNAGARVMNPDIEEALRKFRRHI